MTWTRLLLLLLIAVAVPLAPPAAAQAPSFQRSPLTIDSQGTRHKFTVELAFTPDQMAYGLMFRRSMPADAGMLFVYPAETEITMWMRNTFIPLDMVFIRSDGSIARIAENTTPQSLETIPSGGPARAVLELNGGTAKRLGIQPGDRVQHPLLGLR